MRSPPGSVLAALPCFGLLACAHAPVSTEPVKAPVSFVRPRVEAAARQAAVTCAGKEADRVVEIELGLDGVARGRVLPYDPSGGEATACVERFTAQLPREPPEDVVRSLFRGDGTPVDPRLPRGRALLLRSRIAEQAEPVQRCALEWASRHPRTKGRIGLSTVIGTDGAVLQAAIRSSSLDETAELCVQEATRAMRMARIPGEYRYSFLFVGELAFLGAPDIDPIDAGEMAQATDRIRADLAPCLGAYRTPGSLIIKVTFDNDGLPAQVSVDHAVATTQLDKDDLAADGCVRTVVRAGLRVLPFDGPPVERSIPFTLR